MTIRGEAVLCLISACTDLVSMLLLTLKGAFLPDPALKREHAEEWDAGTTEDPSIKRNELRNDASVHDNP